MNTELQLLGHDKNQADIFFDRETIVTDWDAVRQQVRDGTITKENALHQLKTYEPLREADPRDHAHWIDQQKLRLALLHEAGKPMEGKHTCEGCGSRKVDPLYEDRSWRCVCLVCAERERQVPTGGGGGGRGSCEFLHATYNPRSSSWGLLYYWSHGSDNRFVFWLADFFKNREEAERSLWPIYHYHRWLEIQHNDLISSSLSFTDLLPLSTVMELKLPLTPDQLRELLREAISQDMQKEQALMHHHVKDAMDKHERAERDE